jgi:cell wall-associated NlpC family hydrolase
MPAIRRLLVLAAAAAALLAAPATASALPADDFRWSERARSQVVQAGLMDAGAPEQPLTPAALRWALTGLAARTGTEPVAVPGGPVTVARFHRLLVRQLGLADVADAVQSEARRAGLRPPSRLGDEVVARHLALRFNHPFGQEERELYPSDAIPRGEAAWSLARVLSFQGWETQDARAVFARFVLPQLGPARRRALSSAVSRVGMPYVWGGETDRGGPALGGQEHGGYDCSGLVWRVFKLTGNPVGRSIGGRTAAQQAGEISRGERVPFEAIAPADLLFFGKAGFGSRATEKGITHEGIALSGDFMLHSSGYQVAGVSISPLFEDWRRESFAWGRRVL